MSELFRASKIVTVMSFYYIYGSQRTDFYHCDHNLGMANSILNRCSWWRLGEKDKKEKTSVQRKSS